MANGDVAAGVGYDVLVGTEDRRLGYDEINKTRDYLAQHRLSGTHSWTRIVGLSDQLDDIREKPYIRRDGAGGSDLLASGTVGSIGGLGAQTYRGRWVGDGGLANWQFSPPVSGIYTVKMTCSWNRTTGAAQTGTVWVQFRQGMTENVPNSGTVVRRSGYDIAPTNSGGISDEMYLVSSQVYGFTYDNDTDASIDRRFESSRLYYSVMHQTSVGTVL